MIKVAKSNTARSDYTIALLCAAASLLALLICWPFAPTPFDDDWSYSFMVRQLLRTGHLAYNGWDSAVMLPHIYWGWAWTRAFGFSFDVLRICTFPLAAGSVALVYLLARRAGLTGAYSVFAAMLLGTSPLFMPLAASFMTDVPGVFFILLSLYALVRSADVGVTWLLVGVIFGMVGGASRQIVWVVPLVGVLYLIWLRRADRFFVIIATASWCALIAFMLFTTHWFARQLFVLPEPPILHDLLHPHHGTVEFLADILRFVLTVMLFVLPATEAVVFRWRGWRSMLALVLFIGCVVALRHRPPWAVTPWMGNIFNAAGVMGYVELGGGIRDKMLRDPFRWALSAGVFAVAAFFISAAIFKLVSPIDRLKQLWATVAAPDKAQVTRVLLAIVALAYVGLVLPRIAQGNAFDRYALPLIPCLAIPLLLLCQRYRPAPSVFAWIALSVYGIYAIGTTQELLALGRARAIAADRLIAAGIPRTQIGGGFEFDNWTELETTGHVNSTRIVNPPGIYRRGFGLSPSVRPDYQLEFGPTDKTIPTPFGSVDYTTYWPPFHRKVWIDRMIAPGKG